MAWTNLVVLLVLLQFLFFSSLVSRARTRYSIVAPATSGHNVFERYYRVQMNTMELLIVLVPIMLLAATYWSPTISAGFGAIYLVGRFIYLRAYVKDPKTRALGFGLSAAPILVLALGTLIGIVRTLVAS